MNDYDPSNINAVLSRMEERQKGNTEMLTKVCDRVEKHDEEIQSLKRWRSYVVGIATGAGFLVHKATEFFNGGGK